jgi:hypothetical protein
MSDVYVGQYSTVIAESNFSPAVHACYRILFFPRHDNRCVKPVKCWTRQSYIKI